MATKLTKKQQTQLTEKLTGIIQKNNALQLRLSADRSVNEMNVNQISGALNRIHGLAIGKELPTEITIPVKQMGSGDPSPDNIRPIVGYEIDGIGTVYGGELNIDTGILTVTYGAVNAFDMMWSVPREQHNPYGTYYETAAQVPFIGWRADSGQSSAMSNALYKASISGAANSELLNSFWWNTARTGYRCIWGLAEGDSSLQDFMAFLIDNKVIFVGRLYEPASYVLTDRQMIQLLDQL